MSPVSKTLARRRRDRERALAHLQASSEGTGNVYESYRSLYSLWCSNNSAVPGLKPMFRIPGIEPDDRSTTSLADERFVWVNAEYNSLEAKFLEDAADSLTNHSKELLARDKILLKGKPATRFKIEYGGPKRKMIEEDGVALRSGILYKIGLRTTSINFEADSQRFSKILSNSRWWKIPYCS